MSSFNGKCWYVLYIRCIPYTLYSFYTNMQIVQCVHKNVCILHTWAILSQSNAKSSYMEREKMWYLELVGKGDRRRKRQEERNSHVFRIWIWLQLKEYDDEEISKGISAVPVLDLNFKSSYVNHESLITYGSYKIRMYTIHIFLILYYDIAYGIKFYIMN